MLGGSKNFSVGICDGAPLTALSSAGFVIACGLVTFPFGDSCIDFF